MPICDMIRLEPRCFYSASAYHVAMIDRIFWVEGDWFNNGGTVDEQTYMRRCPMTQHVLETDEHFTGASFQNKQASCIELCVNHRKVASTVYKPR